MKAATHAVEFQDYIRAKITARKATSRDDLLSEILENLSSGVAKLTEDELIIMMTHSFVGAGQETTKLALTNSMYHLLSRRDRWEELLVDRYDLEVIDVYQQPIMARNGQIIATPTLVREFPKPVRRLIGNLAKTASLFVGLDMDTK